MRDRIQARLQLMLDHGYVAECQRLIDEGWERDLKPFKAFAYRFMMDHVANEMSLEDAVMKTELGTWRLLRKQRTWARSLQWQPLTIKKARELSESVF